MRYILLFCLFFLPVDVFAGDDDPPILLVIGDENAVPVAAGLQRHFPELQVSVQSVKGIDTCSLRPKFPYDAKYMVTVVGMHDETAKSPHFPGSDLWKRRLASCIWKLDAEARQAGVQTFWTGLFTSPNHGRQKFLNMQNDWVRMACAAKKIPFVGVLPDILDKSGFWLGYYNNKRINGPDGETLTQEGGALLADKIQYVIKHYFLPVEVIGK